MIIHWDLVKCGKPNPINLPKSKLPKALQSQGYSGDFVGGEAGLSQKKLQNGLKLGEKRNKIILP